MIKNLLLLGFVFLVAACSTDVAAPTSRCPEWNWEWSFSRMDLDGTVWYVEGCAPPEEHGAIMRQCLSDEGCGQQPLP